MLSSKLRFFYELAKYFYSNCGKQTKKIDFSYSIYMFYFRGNHGYYFFYSLTDIA